MFLPLLINLCKNIDEGGGGGNMNRCPLTWNNSCVVVWVFVVVLDGDMIRIIHGKM